MTGNVIAPTPRIVLTIQADTIAELLDAMDAVVGDLNVALTGASSDGAAATITVDLKPEADGAAPKRGRGRPRKADTTPATPAGNGLYEGQPGPAPVIGNDSPDRRHAVAELPGVANVIDPLAAVQAQAPAATAQTVVQDLPPDKAREKGLAMVQQFFAAHPDRLSDITAISQKYGVQHFAEIPDAQAHAFLADVTLLVGGAGQVTN